MPFLLLNKNILRRSWSATERCACLTADLHLNWLKSQMQETERAHFRSRHYPSKIAFFAMEQYFCQRVPFKGFQIAKYQPIKDIIKFQGVVVKYSNTIVENFGVVGTTDS